MTVLVVIPYFGVPDLIERAAASVLAQTHRDLALLVVGDGQEPPLRLQDSRLEVFTLPANRGPYFAQQVALTASPFPSYAPIGADDWVEPDHLERLIAVGGDAVVTGAVWFHNRKGGVSVHHASYEVGLYATDRLRSLGGHNPAERMGQDTLMIRLLRMTGEPRATHHPTYHRVKRYGSLMTHPDTAPGSPARNAMRARNRRVLSECYRLEQLDAIRRYRESIVPDHIRDEVAEQVARLRSRLGQEIAA